MYNLLFSYDLKTISKTCLLTTRMILNFQTSTVLFQKWFTIIIHSKKKKINLEIEFQSDISKEEYLKKILKIKDHIQKGDFYEANYCYQWISKVDYLNSKLIFENLMDLTNPPYGFYADLEKHHIISASPELFIKKREINYIQAL